MTSQLIRACFEQRHLVGIEHGEEVLDGAVADVYKEGVIPAGTQKNDSIGECMGM
jgi:hypothetical protein